MEAVVTGIGDPKAGMGDDPVPVDAAPKVKVAAAAAGGAVELLDAALNVKPTAAEAADMHGGATPNAAGSVELPPKARAGSEEGAGAVLMPKTWAALPTAMADVWDGVTPAPAAPMELAEPVDAPTPGVGAPNMKGSAMPVAAGTPKGAFEGAGVGSLGGTSGAETMASDLPASTGPSDAALSAGSASTFEIPVPVPGKGVDCMGNAPNVNEVV